MLGKEVRGKVSCWEMDRETRPEMGDQTECGGQGSLKGIAEMD